MYKNAYLVSFFFILSLLLTFFIYSFGTNGYFIFDDFANLSRVNSAGGATQSINALLTYLFGHGLTGSRPISFLSFLINDNAWPGDPASFKLTNIYIHLLNGVFIFILCRMLLIRTQFTKAQINITALFAMTLWLLHPLNVSTVLYVVQRMTELSTLFSLLFIIFYIKYRETYIRQPSVRQLISISLSAFPFLVLAFLSKQNAVVSLLFIVILECTLFNKERMSKEFKVWFGFFILTPIVILIIYFTFFFTYTNSFIYRGHTQFEHLMTESRILIDYLSQLFSPNISRMGLIHDDFSVSKGLIQPISTLFSILTIILSIILAILSRKKYYIFSLGVLWFFAGHSLESSFIPLELYFEHRNYLPSIGIMIAFAYLIISLFSFIQKNSIRIISSLIILFILILLLFQTFSLTTIWGNTPLQMAITYEQHPNSSRAAHNYALSIRAKEPVKAIGIYHDSYKQTHTLNSLLLYAYYYCNHYNTLPFSGDILLKESNKLRPIGITYFHLKGLTESILKNQCIDKPKVFLDYLFTSIEKNPHVKYRADDLARIYFVHADIAHSLGDTQGSIQLLNASYSSVPSIDVLLRQSDLLLVRKKYNKVLKVLSKAKTMNNNRKLLQPNRQKDIVLRQKQVTALVAQPISNIQ